jgi:two-component system chemotaxis sensor kinase CheA
MNYKFKLLMAYIGIVVTAFMILYIMFDVSKKSDVNNITSNNFEEKSKEQLGKINDFIGLYSNSIQILHSDKQLIKYVTNSDEHNKKQLEELFLTLKNMLPCIYQIRYIDKDGMEKIKIDGTAKGYYKEKTKSFVVQEEFLQNKQHRSYFKKFSLLKENEIGFSKINLNKEFGKVTVPKTPTLRLGMKVYENKEYKGVLVYNLCLKRLFENLLKTTLFDIYIVDSFGRFIVHNNDEVSLLGEQYNSAHLKDEFPISYNSILQNDTFFHKNYFSILIDAISNGQKLKLILKSRYSEVSSHVEEKQMQFLLLLIFFSIIFIPIVLTFGNKEYYTRKLKELTDLYGNHIITSSTDLDGRIIYVSKAFEQISKYEKKQLLGKSHSIIKGPNTPKKLHREIWENIKNGKKWEGEIQNRAKTGELYWLHTIIEPMYEKSELVGYSALSRDITTQKLSNQLNEHINYLLHNVDEGILSFRLDCKIDDGYSKHSEELFSQKNLQYELINEVLFLEDEKQNEIFLEALEYIKKTDDSDQRELYLSLLPKDIHIKGKNLKIKYKFVDKNTIMLTAMDVTITNKLQDKIKTQKQVQDMIIAIVKNKKEFIETKNEFEKYIGTLNLAQFNINENIKILHTYKGIFAQKGLSNTVKSIHMLENFLKKTKLDKKVDMDILEEEIQLLKLSYMGDVDIILQVMGQDFFEMVSEDFKSSQLEIIQSKINFLLENNIVVDNIILKNILEELLKLNVEPLYVLLNSYPSLVKQLSNKLDKNVQAMQLDGNHNILVPSEYKAFIRSLVHVYRNSIDHGIEDAEDRLLADKDEVANIKTRFYTSDDDIILEISDDGCGIDIERLKTTIVEKQLISKKELVHLSDDKVISFIFNENFSTNKKENIVSGRGVGLFIVQEEIEKIGGRIEVINNFPDGVVFRFMLPNKVKNNINNELEIIAQEAIKYLENSFDVKVEDILVSDAYLPIPETQTILGLDINGDEDSFSSIELDEQLLTHITNLMIPEGEYELSDMEQMKGEIPAEMINTYVGLSLNQFKKIGYDNVSISVPYNLSMSMFVNMLENTSSMKVIRLKTSHGTMTCTLIKK